MEEQPEEIEGIKGITKITYLGIIINNKRKTICQT